MRDQRRQIDFALCRSSERRTGFQNFLQRQQHFRLSMPEDQWPPRSDVINVLLSVDIPDSRTFAARDKQRFAANRPERADRRVDTSGNQLLGLGKELFGSTHNVLASSSA